MDVIIEPRSMVLALLEGRKTAEHAARYDEGVKHFVAAYEAAMGNYETIRRILENDKMTVRELGPSDNGKWESYLDGLNRCYEISRPGENRLGPAERQKAFRVYERYARRKGE